MERWRHSPSTILLFAQSASIAAVVDFDGGGRLNCELTDAKPNQVAIGDRVEMSFRRIVTASGVHNYFWKARPLAPEAGSVDKEEL